MNISLSNIDEALKTISESPELAIDTETTGLYPYRGDSLFSIIIATENKEFYFNFLDYPDENIYALPKPETIQRLKEAISKDKTWYLQNAKFDMHMLFKESIFLKGQIFDLMFLDRVHNNQHMRYNLAEISKRWGSEKLDIVMEYITEHGLKTEVQYPEYGKTETKLHFEKVPFKLMQPYAEQDARATFDIGKRILAAIKAEDELLDKNTPRQIGVVYNESRLTQTLFRMENLGVQLDIPYCKEALAYYQGKLDEITDRFKRQTGVDFVKGTTVFEEVFASEQDKWEKTEKGNWRWDSDTLAGFENPAAKTAIEYAEAKKQSEYFANFLYYSDVEGVLHSDFQQAGTVTSRLSCRDPNLQNLTSPDKYEEELEASKYPVRKAFIPRDGFFFVSIDYSQVEFRLALVYSRSNNLIEEVLNGLDVHTATAKLAGISRKEAKTANFLIVYSGGVVKLASNLYETKGSRHQLGAIYKKMFKWRLSDDEQKAWPTVTDELRHFNEPLIRKAYDIQQSVFRAAPELKDFIKTVQRTAESRGYIRNWYGRRYQFPDKRWCYRASNHLIQGTAADIIKFAMNKVSDLLHGKETQLVLSIHDELLIEVKFGEEYVIEEIKKIMENTWDNKRLPLSVDSEISLKNWANK